MITSIAKAILPGRQTADQIAGQLSEAEQAMAAATSQRAQAALAEAEGVDGAEKRHRDARADVARLEARCSDLRAALQAARDREASAQGAERRTEREHLRAQRIAKAEERERAVHALQASSERYAQDVRRVLQLTSELDALAPPGMHSADKSAAILSSMDVEERIRMELVRHGIAWALAWPWGAAAIQPLSVRFEGVPRVVSEWK